MPRHFSLRSEGAYDIPAFDLISKNQGGGDDFQLTRSMFLFGTLFPQLIGSRSRNSRRQKERKSSVFDRRGLGAQAITAPKVQRSTQNCGYDYPPSENTSGKRAKYVFWNSLHYVRWRLRGLA